jgi:chromosome segregation ATPase
MFNRLTGHFDLQIPSLQGFDWPELEEKAAEIQKLDADFAEAGRTLRELRDDRPKAKRDDTAAYAEAIKAGKKDPGTKAADRLEAQIEAVSRRRDALRVVLGDRANELLALVVKERDGCLAEANTSLSVAEEGLEEARAAVQGAEAEVLRHKQILAFLEDPEGYRPNKVAKKPKKPAPASGPTIAVIGAPPDRGADVA